MLLTETQVINQVLITPLNATPPLFFNELKGETYRRVDCDLTTSKFIPICEVSDFDQYKFKIHMKLDENMQL